MNCHGNNHNGDGKKHNPIKHMLMMSLCCGMPILIIGILPFIKIAGVRNLLATISPFLCPLMMIFMIPMMFKGMKKGDCCSEKEDKNQQITRIE